MRYFDVLDDENQANNVREEPKESKSAVMHFRLMCANAYEEFQKRI